MCRSLVSHCSSRCALVPGDRGREQTQSFDLPGALSATAGITLFVFALVEGPTLGWLSPVVMTSAALSLLLLTAFAVIERRSPGIRSSRRDCSPIHFSARQTAIASLFMATFGSVLYFLSIYLQDVPRHDAMQTGVAFLLPTAVVVAGSALGGRMATR